VEYKLTSIFLACMV